MRRMLSWSDLPEEDGPFLQLNDGRRNAEHANHDRRAAEPGNRPANNQSDERRRHGRDERAKLKDYDRCGQREIPKQAQPLAHIPMISGIFCSKNASAWPQRKIVEHCVTK